MVPHTRSVGRQAMRLVTGGSGVLGRALVEALSARGDRVRILDRSLPPAGVPRGADLVEADIRDRGAVSRACEGCEVVFHLAACMPQSRLDWKGFWDVNVGGTLNVIEASLERGVRRIVFASTIEIYGPRTDLPVREEAQPLFTGTYSRNKWECEQLLASARRLRGIETVALRMPMILGPGFYHEKAMLHLFRSAFAGRPVPLPGRPRVPFQVLWAGDAAAAFVLAADSPSADGEAFNVATADTPPTREVLEAFFRGVGSRSRIVVLPYWLCRPAIEIVRRLDLEIPVVGTPPELLPFAFVGGAYDIAKARRLLGWEPEKDCLAALVETYRWWRTETSSRLT